MELPIPLPSGRTVAKVGGAIVVAMVAYRGLCLYLRNDITISITELVRLPPATVRAGGNRDQIDPAAVTIKGKIEVETSVMRSYRFMLRLAGIVKNEEPTAVATAIYSMPGSPRGGSVGTGFPFAHGGGSTTAATRNRVVSSLTPRAIEGGGLSFHGGNSAAYEDSMSFDRTSTSRKHGGPGSQPTILVDNTNAMVDVCEIDLTGSICFTPACVMDDTLLTYVAAPAPALLASISPQPSIAYSPQLLSEASADTTLSKSSAGGAGAGKATTTVLSTALTGGADGCGNVTVRSCYLEADETAPNAMKLSLEVEVANPVHGLQLLVGLPHRRCRFLHANTGGVGKVCQPMKARKPHRLVWDIGTVDQSRSQEAHEERRRKHRRGHKKGGRRRHSKATDVAIVNDAVAEKEEEEEASPGNRVEVLTGDEDPAEAEVELEMEVQGSPTMSDAREDILCDPVFGARLLIARCTIVFEQPTDIFYEEQGDDSSASASGIDDDEDEMAGRHSEDEEINEDEMFATAAHRVDATSTPMRKKGRAGPASSSRARARGTASAPNQSHKAARREARRQQRKEEKQKRRADAVVAARGASTRLPTVEITYSTSGLASGTSIKKLQVVSDKPNWVPRSLVDRFVLKPVLRGLDDMKLKRFAHYTTWFVQPVPVTTLAL